MTARVEGYGVSRVTGVLELLADGPRSINRIAEAINIHPRTARRILRRLAHDGYAQREPHAQGRYTLALRFTDLALRALRHNHDHHAAKRPTQHAAPTPAALPAARGPDESESAPAEPTTVSPGLQRARYAYDAASLNSELHVRHQLLLGQVELAAMLDLAAHGELLELELAAHAGSPRRAPARCSNASKTAASSNAAPTPPTAAAP
jgi:DNA-binding HxlR family transcriptional regulator